MQQHAKSKTPGHSSPAYSWMVTAAELYALAARIILAQPTDYVFLEMSYRASMLASHVFYSSGKLIFCC